MATFTYACGWIPGFADNEIDELSRVYEEYVRFTVTNVPLYKRCTPCPLPKCITIAKHSELKDMSFIHAEFLWEQNTKTSNFLQEANKFLRIHSSSNFDEKDFDFYITVLIADVLRDNPGVMHTTWILNISHDLDNRIYNLLSKRPSDPHVNIITTKTDRFAM